MPMDYDDDEISRHNLQLAGEGRTRSSSTSKPFDFPKFDFGDSLQGHVRFDSLVETEVFLGIQSQEDNQWIEDFSRGSNGMEFNSTPADSCSMSRRNNVWSEATSSETVEMLLKSVGQEEMMPGASTLQEPNATTDQGTLGKLVETSTKLNERCDAHILNSDATLLPDGVRKEYPASVGHMEEQLKNPSGACTKDELTCGNSSNLNQNDLCGNGGGLIKEGEHPNPDECASEKLEESKTSVEKTMDSVPRGDSLGFPNTDDNVDSGIGMLSASIACQQVKSKLSCKSYISDGQEADESAKTGLEDIAIWEGKAGFTSIPISTASSSIGLVPDSGMDSQEANVNSVREAIDVVVKGKSQLKSSEGYNKNTLQITSTHSLGSEKDLVLCDEVDKPFADCQGGSSMVGIVEHSAEIGNLSSGHCASSDHMADATVQLPHKHDNEIVEDASLSPPKFESMSEVPLPSMEGNETPTATADCIGDTNIGYSSDMAMLSSAAGPVHIFEGCGDDAVVTEVDSDANSLTQNMDVSTQVIQENVDHREVGFSYIKKDICNSKEADKEVSGDVGMFNSENVEKTQFLEAGKEVEGNDAIHQLHLQTSDEPESANDVSDLATINASMIADDLPEVGQSELAATRLLHSDDDREEAGMKKIFDANSGAKADSAVMVEASVINDTIQNPTSEMVVMSQQPVEKIDDVCTIVPSSMVTTNSSYSDHPQLDSISNKSSLKESDDADLVSGESLEKTMTIEEEKVSAQTAEIDKASCGSPTIISSSDPSLTEKDYQEEGKGYQAANEFEDSKIKDPLKDDSSFTFKVNALPDSTDREPVEKWSPFPDVEKCKVLEETAPSGKGKTDRTPSQKMTSHNARLSDGEIGSGSSKGTSERKGRRGSAKGTSKENLKKRNLSKGSNQENASAKVEKVSSTLLSTPSSSPHVKFAQMQPYGNIESCNKQLSAAIAVPVPISNLPDLNSSALNSITSPSTTFRQPFSDLQQVQLRAQIFVYGSLIQGTAPDEACMVSAFGPSDGRCTWEPTWRVTVERVRSKKSSSTAAETPSRSQSGTKASDAIKQGLQSSNGIATPVTVSRVSSKDTPAAASNPIFPLSSPLWNISTPSRDSLTSNVIHKGPVMDFQQAVMPMHAYQTPPIMNFVGHTSWPLQTCFPGPWLASPQTATFSLNARFNPVTMTETVKLTPVKDTSAVLTSSVKHTTSSPAVHTVGPSPALGRVSPLHESKLTASAEQRSVDSKPKKRKKAASGPGQVSLVSQALSDTVAISNATLLPTSPVGASASVSQPSDAIFSQSAADASAFSNIDHPKKDYIDTVKTVPCSEGMLGNVAEAKTQAEDTSAVLTSSVKHTTSTPAVHTVGPSPALGGVSPLHDPKLAASAEQRNVDSKSRKRKKVASGPGQVSLVSQALSDTVAISNVTLLPTSPVGASAAVSQPSDAILSQPAADASGFSTIDHPNKDCIDTVKTVACSEGILGKVAEAQNQADDAADVATAAVSQCEDLWSQLAKQRESGLTSEAEAKLASAAVAIAAAASVAKAAAAAAKIACNAALQAKLMADEAFLSSKTCGVVSSSGKFSSDVHDTGNATPVSILKSNNVTNQSSSILVAAKEAAKRRVEAASAASKQAENLDAIVKAAELAAAAVSQAGKIVAMGEPLPLNDLIEAGPEGYWKISQPSGVMAEKAREGNMEQPGAFSLGKSGDISVSIPAEDSIEKGGSRIVYVNDVHTTEGPDSSSNASMSLSIDIMSSEHRDEKDVRAGIEHGASDTSESGRVAPELDALQRTINVENECDELGTRDEECIKEGSLVEVFNPGKLQKAAWFSATVLSLEEGKAYVCYNDVLSKEGSGNVRDWVPLEGEGDTAPIIRTVHPSSALQQQTRKRRRDALGDYAWCVGDRVDVWIDDCWWEGVVTEKNEKDETTLKVHISAQGETSTVRAWNLRASRSWINGKWIVWSSIRGRNASEQGDTPREKRQKLGISPIGNKTKEKEVNKFKSALGQPEKPKFLTLSTSERTFDIGKTTNYDSKRATRRPLRTNQQKEGSRVVIGGPNPTGKKRKFMEVSKHFPANKIDKSTEVNEAVQFQKFLKPQVAASQGWKLPSRHDTKEKRMVESRQRVLGARKALRNLPRRENSRSTLAQDADNQKDRGNAVENSVGHDENTSDKSVDHGSDAFEEAAEAPLSSLLAHSLSTTSKRTSSSNTKSDRLTRGRLGPSGGKLSKIEEDKSLSDNTVKSAFDVSEPRRSNRRIQPTHRLLEGLQSSMVIPKMPSVSHDKGRRNVPSRGK